MPEYWFENPKATRRTAGRRRRRSSHARQNTGGTLMVINRKRRRHRRRTGRMPAALARYWAGRRNEPNPRRRRRHRVRRRVVRVRHILANRRRRRVSRAGGGGGVPSTMRGFVSVSFLTQAGFAALGAFTPTLITDRLLPAVGFSTTGWTRRLIQLAVPAVVVLAGGKRFLGRGAGAFVLGAAGVTMLGVVNDLTGGIATVARYQLPPPVMGRYQRPPAVLYAR